MACYGRIRQQYKKGQKTEAPFYPHYVPVGETDVKERIKKFLDAGYSHRTLSVYLDLEAGFVPRLMSGEVQKIKVTNLDKIEGAKLVPLYDLWKQDLGIDYFVPSWLGERRIRSLSAVGWSRQEVANRLGVAKSAISNTALRKRGDMKRSALVRLDEVYRELSMIPSPIPEQSRHKSVRESVYPRPFEWNEGEIDTPGGETMALKRAQTRIMRQRKLLDSQ
jgi:transcriptional regulator with XRE-family HTH domain